ncbi:FAD/NAD(P)-binding domain-containing protein [Xylaria grammica]|nr:FAD/NAD(P)-binding domain-containing protein [Xylaria grammica]
MGTVSRTKPLRVVIIGGSLSGLMCGIALKHAGHTVTICEKEDNERQSHMAGVCLGSDAEEFLLQHDRIVRPFSHTSLKVQALRDNNSVRVFVYAKRNVTNWDAFYFRLRSCFDGYISSHYPSPPDPVESDGAVKYEHLTEALDISCDTDKGYPQMVLTFANKATQKVFRMEADLVIAADGPNSFVRNKYLPKIQRQYVGYIAWRGTVHEKEVSASTRAVFVQNITLYMMPREHCVVYAIPGRDGTCEPGERLLNFLWYTNESAGSLEEIMTDAFDSRRHHNIVPAGHVRKDVWNRLLNKAQTKPLPAPLLDIIAKIKRPFIQVITELSSPRAAFENGRVLVVGDALSLYRPHTAFSATQAAFHALCVQRYVNGDISLHKWEGTVLRYALLHSSQSACYGKFYQHWVGIALVAGLHYWLYCVIDKVMSFLNGEKSLLRSTIKVEIRSEGDEQHS